MKFVGKERITKRRTDVSYTEEIRIISGQEVKVKVYEAEKSPEPITGLEAAFLNSLRKARSN